MIQKEILLLREAGEFCTERTHPELPRLRKEIATILEQGEAVLIRRDGVKLLTTSFIDELLSPTAKTMSFDVVKSGVQFLPALEEFYWEQVRRGIRLRS